MSSLRKGFSAGFVLAFVYVGQSVASCGSASCPIDVYTQEKTEKGMIRLDYSYEYINQDQPRIGRDKAEVGEIRGHHDEISTLSQTQRIAIDAGLTSRWSLQAVLPFVHREHQHVHHHQGADVLESWNFDGMSDLTLVNRVAVLRPERSSLPLVSAIVGGVLPTGRRHVANAEGDEAEVGILPGKGAVSLILGLSTLQSFSVKTLSGPYAAMPLFFSSTYQWNGKSQDDYKVGDIWIANVGLTYPLLPKVGFMNQFNLRVQKQDDRGHTFEEVQKTGGTFVYYSPGVQLTMAENLWSYLYVQIPVYQRVNVIQLTSDYNLMTGLSYKFSAL